MGSPTVPYRQEHAPAPEISASAQGLQATIRFRVDWQDAFGFVNQVLGLLDGVPWAWPASPNMRAYEAKIRPVGLRKDVATQVANLPLANTPTSAAHTYGSTPGQYYQYAHVDVTFGSQASLAMSASSGTASPPAHMFDQTVDIPMSTYQVTFAADYVKIPGGAIQWANTTNTGANQTVPANIGAPDAGGVYFRTPSFDMTMTLYNQIFVDYSQVQAKIGLVNQSTMFSFCAPETLLLSGVSTNRREMASGIVVIDCNLNYKWRKLGWNYCQGDNGTFYRYTAKATNAPIYATADINPLSVIQPTWRWNPTNLNGYPGR